MTRKEEKNQGDSSPQDGIYSGGEIPDKVLKNIKSKQPICNHCGKKVTGKNAPDGQPGAVAIKSDGGYDFYHRYCWEYYNNPGRRPGPGYKNIRILKK